LRAACRAVAEQASSVKIDAGAVRPYALALDLPSEPGPDPDVHLRAGSREERAAFWLTLDAINFGSGWFPTLRKRPGHSGYLTVAAGLKDRFAAHGAWSAQELLGLDAPAVAQVLGQDPGHELMVLFAASLNDLGVNVLARHGGS